MPSDFLFPPPDDAENTMGKSGHIQGAKIVINPAKNEKTSSVIIEQVQLPLPLFVIKKGEPSSIPPLFHKEGVRGSLIKNPL